MFGARVLRAGATKAKRDRRTLASLVIVAMIARESENGTGRA
jgi:hypothetical protein